MDLAVSDYGSYLIIALIITVGQIHFEKCPFVVFFPIRPEFEI